MHKSRIMRMWMVVVVLGWSSLVDAQQPSLLLRAGNPESAPARQLYAAVVANFPGWDVSVGQPVAGINHDQRVANARADLESHDVVVWVEQNNFESRRSSHEHIVMLTNYEEDARSFPINRLRRIWSVRAAIYLRIYLQRIQHRAARVAAGEKPRWPTRMPRNGWALRVGAFAALTPRTGADEFGFAETYVTRAGGLNLHVGRWLTRAVRLDLSLNLGKAENDLGAHAGLGTQLAIVSPTRVRMGVALGLEALFVRDVDNATGDRYGWVGFQFSPLFEFGWDFSQRMGMLIHMGPTVTKLPHDDVYAGFVTTFGFEFDLGVVQQGEN